MARGARFNMRGSKQFIARATAFSANLENTGADAVLDAAKLGADVMEERILHSGTGWEGREGRTDSRKMLENVDSDTTSRRGRTKGGAASRSARFGWIDGWADYYRHQEEGFVNLRKNRENEGTTWGGTEFAGQGGPPGWTEGMGAYAAGFIAARERLRQNVDHITRRAWYRR